MRKTSYVVTFFMVLATLIINIISARRGDWLTVKGTGIARSKTIVRYGLTKRCERQVVEIPGPDNSSVIAYTDYECRAFPLRVRDACETDNRGFCTSWGSATYLTELGIGFAAMALVAILIGVSTHSRRRRVWRAIAAFVAVHAVFQLATFIIVTEIYRTSKFSHFSEAKPGTGYILNVVSWVVGISVTAGVVTTGISADKGHKWAAGNRAYRPIEG